MAKGKDDGRIPWFPPERYRKWAQDNREIAGQFHKERMPHLAVGYEVLAQMYDTTAEKVETISK